jgi:hypothetical protein
MRGCIRRAIRRVLIGKFRRKICYMSPFPARAAKIFPPLALVTAGQAVAIEHYEGLAYADLADAANAPLVQSCGSP